jgi:phosphatidylserine/phosphatidylglycerophosphate/cardiolipin synthase-like enzyme
MSAPRSSTLPAANLEPARWLRTGAIAYTRMLELINNAKVSIRCETYIWGNDAVGGRFLSAFAQAAARGVSVQVLIDGAGSSGLPDDYWHALSRAGGEAPAPPGAAPGGGGSSWGGGGGSAGVGSGIDHLHEGRICQ